MKKKYWVNAKTLGCGERDIVVVVDENASRLYLFDNAIDMLMRGEVADPEKILKLSPNISEFGTMALVRELIGIHTVTSLSHSELELAASESVRRWATEGKTGK